jgi:hypothetical protein
MTLKFRMAGQTYEAAIWTMPLFTVRLVRWKLLTFQVSCYLTQTFWGPIVDHCGRALR